MAALEQQPDRFLAWSWPLVELLALRRDECRAFAAAERRAGELCSGGLAPPSWLAVAGTCVQLAALVANEPKPSEVNL